MKPSPKRATLERQGKRKPEADGKRDKTSGGGGRQKRLNQPDTAKTYINLSTQRAKPTWREENARTHEIGTHGELVNDMMHPHRRAIFPSLGSMARVQVTTLWTADVFNPWITCTISTSPKQPKEKWPNLESMSCYLIMSKWLRSVSWYNRTKVVVASGYKPLHLGKMVKPHAAAGCSTLTRPTCETMKNGQQFTLLKRITNSKM